MASPNHWFPHLETQSGPPKSRELNEITDMEAGRCPPHRKRTAFKHRLVCWVGPALAALHTVAPANNNSCTTVPFHLGSLCPPFLYSLYMSARGGPTEIKVGPCHSVARDSAGAPSHRGACQVPAMTHKPSRIRPLYYFPTSSPATAPSH